MKMYCCPFQRNTNCFVLFLFLHKDKKNAFTRSIAVFQVLEDILISFNKDTTFDTVAATGAPTCLSLR